MECLGQTKRSEILQYSNENPVETTPATGVEEERAAILMAEDNMVNQKLSKLLFKKLNMEIDMVANGEEAVERCKSGKYQLVFMDIQMPVMDGMEATRQIKNLLGDDSPCIVALTANAMTGDREKYINCGMDDYLPKPLSLNTLKEVIEKYVVAD